MVMSALPNSPSPVDLGAFQLGNLGADVGAPLDQKIVGDRPPHPICFSTVVLCSIGGVWEYGAVPKRRIIVNLATSADGYIARPDGNLDWLTSRPIPKGFYGLGKFSRSVDAKILGRKTFDVSVKMGARFSANDMHYVFSRQKPSAPMPAGVQFVQESIRPFIERLRQQAGKHIWMMGGGEIIGSFLDEDAIDEFIISVVPTFIVEGIPLIAPKHREVSLRLRSVQRFPDGVVQLHYTVKHPKA
jgi:dihydrofolate reductase